MPAEWVVAAGADSDRDLLYLHGGAYQIGSPGTHRSMVARLSRAARARVLSVGYRLAPEYPFPAAVDDAVAAYRWLLGRGTNPAVLAVAKPAGMAETARTYLAGQDPRHPYASPLYADVHGLPPVLIHVGDAEVILDDSTRFAARARDHGVDVTLEVWDEMPHVWHAFAGLLPEADQAIERIDCWLIKRIPAP